MPPSRRASGSEDGGEGYEVSSKQGKMRMYDVFFLDGVAYD